MSKTIEEAAKEYYLNEVINGDTCDDKDGWTDCFVSGAKALMQLPLSSRLTAEEKERVRKMYKELSECIENRTADVEYLKGKRCQLVIIFGSNFFKEEE